MSCIRTMAAAVAFFALALAVGAETAPRPHLIFFMVDDWGWANVGYHRNESGTPPLSEVQTPHEVQTPNIDALVAEGVELDRHYTYQWCTPSRTAFLSGRLPVHLPFGLGNLCNPGDGIPRNMTAIAAVLKRANYSTHQLGKWDAGMSTPGHTPRGRGFDSSLGYFDHENDYYDFRPETPFNTTFERGPCPSTRQYKDLWDTDGPAAAAAAGAIAAGEYEEALLLERATRIIQSHDLGGGGGGNGIGGVPLFLYYAFHIAHTPLQVPAEWLAKFDFIADSDTRKAYHAMVAYMDHVVGNVTAQLRQRGMWNNTLIVSSSDNGGPIYAGGGANNYPFRGGKLSDWEGGVRANAFVSGGFLPAAVRGTKATGIMSIADWYATFAALAGVDDAAADPRAAAAGLPGVDSVDMWPMISSGGANTSCARTYLHVSPSTFISGRHKLIVGGGPGGGAGGAQAQARVRGARNGGSTDQNGWPGPVYPNASSGANGAGAGDLWPAQDCSAGCVFDIFADPGEHDDLGPQNPELRAKLIGWLATSNRSIYAPPRQPNDARCCSQADENGGFMGPWLP